MNLMATNDESPLMREKQSCETMLNLYEAALMSVKSLYDVIDDNVTGDNILSVDDDNTTLDDAITLNEKMMSAIKDVLTNIRKFYSGSQAYK